MPTFNVVDLSHHNTIAPDGFAKMKAAGILGVIHKATQGTGVVDDTLDDRYTAAKAVGLLWGTYHFLRAGNVAAQVDHYLTETDPDDDTLLALDHEDGGGASLADAIQFLTLADKAAARKLVLYSGNRIKTQLHRPDAFLSSHRLWLAQYGPRAVCPPGWSAPWLWQFGEKGACPWITGNADHNHYAGTPEQLAKEWAGTVAPVPTINPGHLD